MVAIINFLQYAIFQLQPRMCKVAYSGTFAYRALCLKINEDTNYSSTATTTIITFGFVQPVYLLGDPLA